MKTFIPLLLLSALLTANAQQLRRQGASEVEQRSRDRNLQTNDRFVTSQQGKDFRILTSNTPTLRLDQDNQQGWGEYAWEVAGNEANFFIRDVTNSNTLPFRIDNGAPMNSIYIRDSGAAVINGGNNPFHPDTDTKLYVKGGNLVVDGTIQSTTTTELQNRVQQLEDQVQHLEDQVQQLLNRRS